MNSLEESIAIAMDWSQDAEIVPFLPYILQDFWELGTPSETVINFVQKYCENYSSLHVLDLGCGKGAVSVNLAAKLKCHCYGIDGMAEFIEVAKRKAKEYGVDSLCQFEIGDIRQKIEELDNKFNVIILGAIGQVFGNYFTTLTTLAKHLTKEGILIINDAYIDDASTFQHTSVLSRKELLKQIEQSEMRMIDEFTGKDGESSDSAKEMKYIIIRCQELKTKFPEKASLFEKYVQTQTEEYAALENDLIGSIMVLKKA